MMHSCRTLFGALALTLTLPFASSLQAQEPVKAGFVYVSPIGDAGWTYQHDLGRLQMEKSLAGKVTSRVVENVQEGPDAERVRLLHASRTAPARAKSDTRAASNGRPARRRRRQARSGNRPQAGQSAVPQRERPGPR